MSGSCPRCEARRVLPAPCPTCGYHGFTLDEWKQRLPQVVEVERLMHDGQKIQAIKALRELTRCGLKEAKDAVEQFAVGGLADLPWRAVRATYEEVREVPSGTHPLPPPAELIAMLREGRKIEAIRIVRECTGMNLAEAKTWVEGLERPPAAPAPLPPSPATAPPVQAPPGHGVQPAPGPGSPTAFHTAPTQRALPRIVGAERPSSYRPAVLMVVIAAVIAAIAGHVMGWWR